MSHQPLADEPGTAQPMTGVVIKNTFLTRLDEDEEAQKPRRRCFSCPSFLSFNRAATKDGSPTSDGAAQTNQARTNHVMEHQVFQAKDDTSTTSHLHTQTTDSIKDSASSDPLPSVAHVEDGRLSSKLQGAPSEMPAKANRYLKHVQFKAQPCWVHWHPRSKCKRNCRFGHDVSELVAAFSKLTPTEIEEAARMAKENWALKAQAAPNEEIHEIVRNCRKVGHAMQSLLLPAANAALQCLARQSEQSWVPANSTAQANLSHSKP